MSRLAASGRVFFLEEPVFDAAGPARLQCSSPAPGVQVLVPHTPIEAGGFHDDQLAVLQPLLQQFVQAQGLDGFVAWLYTPMALPLVNALQPRLLVYDCMDELSGFLGAPRQLRQREGALIKQADLLITGGPSLFAAKAGQHPDAHCLPSGVDAHHFAPERLAADGSGEAAAAQALMRGVSGPRLGYVGVVDERLDLRLLADLADERPQWQWLMAGPVAKIDAGTLPQRPNLHWLGMQPYARLPHLVVRWDVCIMPFDRNDATRFISPTKTLEYLAARKPVVSTPIADVARLYGQAVRLAQGPDDFIAACEAALHAAHPEAAALDAAGQQAVAASSWDRRVAQVRGWLQQALARRRDGDRGLLDNGVSETTAATRARPVANLIAGAGPTGLAAACELGRDGRPEDTLLVERHDRVGGWCRSIQHDGFTFDHAGHIMFSEDPYVLDLYRRLLGANVHWQNREAWIYSNNVYTRYPFQGSLYGLPPQVLKECLVGAIEARFGPLQAAVGGADSVAVLRPEPANFEQFIQQVWGAGIARHFATPYNRKLWTVPLAEMETSWLKGRVPLPDLERMIQGALEPTPAPMGPNARFGYPLRGGFQALMDGFLPLLNAELALDTALTHVSPARRRATLSDGRVLAYDQLISTMPLPQLVQACGDEAPADVREAARGLRHVAVRCVNLGVSLPEGRTTLCDKHWIYYPEDTVFHRIFLQGNASPYNSPEGGFGLSCEISYGPDKPLPCSGEALTRLAIADCHRVGIFGPRHRVLSWSQVDMPGAYVVYDHGRAARVQRIRDWLAGFDIVLAGRYSEWEYYNSDHAFLAGRKAAAAVRARRRPGAAVEAAAGD